MKYTQSSSKKEKTPKILYSRNSTKKGPLNSKSQVRHQFKFQAHQLIWRSFTSSIIMIKLSKHLSLFTASLWQIKDFCSTALQNVPKSYWFLIKCSVQSDFEISTIWSDEVRSCKAFTWTPDVFISFEASKKFSVLVKWVGQGFLYYREKRWWGQFK